jgi:transcriptional regulator with GAF, ATPase, and Fis domain
MASEHGEPSRGERSRQAGDSARGKDKLAIELGEVARSLQQIDDPDELLQEVVISAVHIVAGAEEGSIADVTARRTIEHKAATSEWVRRSDLFMQDVGQGPCLDTVWEQRTVRVNDLATDQRWPKFSERATEFGARSMLAIQLYVEDDNLGALNLYSRTPNAFDDESEHTGLLVATHAAIAYADTQKQKQLEGGMDTRGLIGQAMGILMERHKLDRGRAFNVLARYSQHSNRKLVDIADDIVRDADAAAQ